MGEDIDLDEMPRYPGILTDDEIAIFEAGYAAGQANAAAQFRKLAERIERTNRDLG